MADTQPILVTGASGYIALHIVRRLLEEGHRVRGTVRSIDKADTVRQALAPLVPTDQLEFVAADLTKDEGWADAVKDCTYVLHTASPFPPRAARHEDDLIVPAREGTLRVLRAAGEADVRRVVLTSSLAAIHNTTPRKQRYDETSWSETDGDIDAYSKSKTLAERAAWEYVGGLPVDRGMELVSINPSVVLGPLLEPSGSTSVEIVRKFLAREVPGSPRYGLPMVDVRDVAEAHIRALQVRSAAGNRYLCSGPFHWLDDVAATLKRSGYNVPTRQLPNWLVRTVGLFDPTVRMIVRDLGVSYDIDNSKIRRDLNWSPRDIDRTVLDTAESLRAHGVV